MYDYESDLPCFVDDQGMNTTCMDIDECSQEGNVNIFLLKDFSKILSNFFGKFLGRDN